MTDSLRNRREAASFHQLRVGIVGGGQLAKMLTMEAKKIGFSVFVLDPSPGSPAGQVADHQIVGGFFDREKLGELAALCDVLTYDLEHVDTAELGRLAASGHNVQPAPRLLEVIQDKLLQKELLADAGLPVPEFVPLERPDPRALRDFGFPLVQKLRKGGYDGRGVAIMREEGDLSRILDGPSLLERCVAVEKELAVMVACGTDGEVRVYPVAEMTFDSRTNALDLLLVPARITPEQTREAQSLAQQTARAFGGVGIFGVELFLTRGGELLVNEVAPRPHNSGHYTIEACVISQYEQHLRAIAGLPLGSTELLCPAAMINLVGEKGAFGRPVVRGLPEALAMEGVTVHIYGKSEVRPFRKMGHAVVVDRDLEKALVKANRLKDILTIEGDSEQ